MLDSVQKISKKCGKAPTNYLQRILPGIDLEKYEYLKYTFESVINEANLMDLDALMVQSENYSMTNDTLFSDSITEQSSKSLIENLEKDDHSPVRKIPEIWNTHNKLHCEKIKLRYHLQSTQTALDRTITASKKLPVSSKLKLLKFSTPVQETKFLRQTNSTSKCYVKKKSYSFEKFAMSSSFSEMSKWQR